MISVILLVGDIASSGATGIALMARVAGALGIHACCAASRVVAANTRGAQLACAVDEAAFRTQLDAVLAEVDCRAVVVGELAGEEHVASVADRLTVFSSPNIVVTHRQASSSTPRFAGDPATSAWRDRLVPLARLLVLDRPAAESLGGIAIRDANSAAQSANALLSLGPRAVLIVDVRGESSATTMDVLADARGTRELASPAIPKDVVGLDDALSAAIAGELAKGTRLEEAIRAARAWTFDVASNARELGSGKRVLVF